MRRIIPLISFNKMVVTLFGLMLISFMAGCGGGGGGSDGGGSGADKVAISGTVDDGTPNSPIREAKCVFVDLNGDKLSETDADKNGNFTINVVPNNEGYIRCSPLGIPKLNLSTFLSTEGRKGKDKISGEDVTPTTTVVADIINSENSTDPMTRRDELLADIENGDAELKPLVEAYQIMFKKMLDRGINVSFGAGGEGGSHDPGDPGGGVSGDTGDGADFSPIPNAACDFSLELEGMTLYSAALEDLRDGKVDRPDLAAIKDDVEKEIKNIKDQLIKAYNVRFPNGVGEHYSREANGSGKYFLPLPPDLQGFVRCAPPSQSELKLATFVSTEGLAEDEKLPGQDVNPATTFFSHSIASVLSEDLKTVKDNFDADKKGLGDIRIIKDGETIKEFKLKDSAAPMDDDVGLVAFSAASLFNILYKNGANVDYLAALDGLIDNQQVRSKDLEAIGIPEKEADQWSKVVNASNEDAGEELDTSLDKALSKARIEVTVIDKLDEDGNPIPIGGAEVKITDAPSYIECDFDGEIRECDSRVLTTNARGEVIFTLTKVKTDAANIEVEVSAVAGFEPISKTTQVVAFATVDLTIPFSYKLTVEGDGDGNGTVTSIRSGIDCSISDGVASGGCSVDYDADTEVTLTADALDGFVFDGWSGGDCSGTGDCTVTMNETRTVTAKFTKEACAYTIKPASSDYPKSGGNGTISVDASRSDCSWNASKPKAVDWIDFTSPTSVTGDGKVSYEVSKNSGPERTATLTVAGERHKVTQGGSLSPPKLIKPLDGEVMDNNCEDGSDKLIWDFSWEPVSGATKYQIRVIRPTTGEFYIDKTDSSTSYHHEKEDHYESEYFKGWKWRVRAGDDSGEWSDWSERTFDIEPLNTDCQFTLTVQGKGNGTGTVTSSPGDINCTIDGTSESGECSDAFNLGTPVALMADRTGGSTFGGWSGDADCADGKVTMDSNKTCTATFTLPIKHTLKVTKRGDGGGTVTSDPPGISCGADCEEDYTKGRAVSLTAKADKGSKFTGWGGDADCKDGKVVMDSDLTCTAAFARIPIPVPALVSPPDKEVMDNNCEDRSDKLIWDFSWRPVSVATKYQIRVIRPTTGEFYIDVTDSSTSYHHEKEDDYESEYFKGWKWRVRAGDDSGEWSGWSERSFDIEPLNTDCPTPTGSLKVTIEPAEARSAGAKWSVDGGKTWNDSGHTQYELSVGSHKVIYKPLDGWDKPEPEDVELVKDKTTETSGIYTKLGLPDLVIDGFDYSGNTASVPTGSAIGKLIKLTVKNIGMTDVGGFFVGFYISSDPVITAGDTLLVGGREFVDNLAAGASIAVPLYEGAEIPEDMALGRAFLGVFIDELGDIEEVNEANNTASLPINITAPNIVPDFNFVANNQGWRMVGFYDIDDEDIYPIDGFFNILAPWWSEDGNGAIGYLTDDRPVPPSPTGSAFVILDFISPYLDLDGQWQETKAITYRITGRSMASPLPIYVEAILNVKKPDDSESYFSDFIFHEIPLGSSGGWTTHTLDVNKIKNHPDWPEGTVILDLILRIIFELPSSPKGRILIDNVTPVGP